MSFLAGSTSALGVAIPKLKKAGFEASCTMTCAISLRLASAALSSALESLGSVTGLSRGGETRFLTTDTCEHFDHLAAVFMGQPLASEKIELAC